jgi:flagellar basal body-associated protein FliL
MSCLQVLLLLLLVVVVLLLLGVAAAALLLTRTSCTSCSAMLITASPEVAAKVVSTSAGQTDMAQATGHTQPSMSK